MPTPSKILIVDDEPNALRLLRNLLTPDGYKLLFADSGAEALRVAQSEIPDVVLLDVMMPEMDGYQVCTHLRADPALANIPILMLTALDDRESMLRGLEAGADDFLAKPFDSIELRARIRAITRLNRFRQLYEERARMEAAITYAPYGVVLAELDGKILQRNAAFTRLLAPASTELDNFYNYLSSEVAAKLQQTLAANLTTVMALEATLTFALNPATEVEISCALIPWQGRRLAHFVVRDRTEEKQLEEQLLHSQRIELLGQLAGSTIHDVNNILSAIYGSAQLIEMKGGQDYKIHLDQIITSTERGASMLRQLMMFARGDDEALELTSPTAPTAEVAGMIKETFGRLYEVNYEAAADLPRVLVDPTQIHQIVMNLCVNARDAMPDGGQLTISLTRRTVPSGLTAVMGDNPAAGDYVVLSVRDNGTGIPAHILPKLFDPFFSTKPKGKGTGLGLATVIRLVRRHKGFVTLETTLGQGTCFHCHFPIEASPRE